VNRPKAIPLPQQVQRSDVREAQENLRPLGLNPFEEPTRPVPASCSDNRTHISIEVGAHQ
jgi:hypothetical protein